MITASVFKDKNVAVIGLGITGISAARALSKGGANIFAWDDFDNGRNKLESEKLHNVTILPPTEYDWSTIEALVLSAGIPLTHPTPHPVVELAHKANCPIICDVEILYQQCPEAFYVGITGTNGKSTTTSLIGHIAKQANLPCDIGGNLGTSATDFTMRGKGGAYIIEMSSYQLDLLQKLHFNTSILLNITPDHLDRHGGIEGYIKAKSHIFDRQDDSDYAIIAVDDIHTQSLYEKLYAEKRIGNIIPISGYTPLEKGVFIKDNQLVVEGFKGEGTYSIGKLKYLPGNHNAQNIAASVAACLSMDIDIPTIIKGIQSFTGLAHRMQLVCESGKLTFINDSKATNAEATLHALRAFSNKDIYWIAGGVAKDGGINSLAECFGQIKHTYLIGESQKTFSETLSQHNTNHTAFDSLKDALDTAIHDAKKSNNPAVILFSPACASFDMWKNFEERGKAFCDLVKETY